MISIDPNDRRVLVFGHADGGGHLAAEQSRKNLEKDGALSCEVIVDPRLTRSYRFWERTLPHFDLGEHELVVIVDLMLDPNEPKRSFEALADYAARERDRQFLVINYHMQKRLPRPPSNVILAFTSTAFLCCYGMPSNLMVTAAICERDDAPVKHLITPIHRKRATGIARAAADVSVLAGERLMALLRVGRWDLIELLADDPPEAHRRVRGIRVAEIPPSPALTAVRTESATV